MPSKHARLSPSGASKWMLCPASLAAERGITERRSEHAAEGTAAHGVAELVLRAVNPSWRWKRPEFKRTCAADYVGERVENWLITDDMSDPIQTYIDTVLAEAEGRILHVEQRVDFSHVVGVRGSFGTADAVIINGDELQVHDLKFGRGVRVDAYQNKQLMIYALGALRMFDLGDEFNTVRLFIHQPRLNHVSEWALPVADLLKFGKEVKKAAKLAIKLFDTAEAASMEHKNTSGPAIAPEHYNPGEAQCRWCKAAPTCKAYAQKVYETVAGEFVDLDAAEFNAVDPMKLTDEQLIAAHANLDFIDAWCGKVRKWVYSRLLDGGGLPGLKVVEGRAGARAWANKEDAESLLLELEESGDIYTRKIVTPTQAEKLFKHDDDAWQRLQSLIVRPAGAPVVVPESDRRPALSVSDDFTDVSNTQ